MYAVYTMYKLGYFSLMNSYCVSKKNKTFTKHYLFIFQTNNNEVDQISIFFFI